MLVGSSSCCAGILLISGINWAAGVAAVVAAGVAAVVAAGVAAGVAAVVAAVVVVIGRSVESDKNTDLILNLVVLSFALEPYPTLNLVVASIIGSSESNNVR